MASDAAQRLDLATSRHNDGGMPDWNRLKEHVINRRVELGHPTREDFTTASGISYRILGDIERGTRTSYGQTTLAKLERALHWAPGSVSAILDGGNPTPATTGKMTAVVPTVAAALSLAEDLAADPVMRILNSPATPEIKQQIVARLLAEQKQFAQRRVDELLREALAEQAPPPAD